MLSVENLNVTYAYKNVLNDVSVSFSSGKVHLILGENGAGKTTLAKILCGDIKADSGKIFLDDKEVSFSSPRDALAAGIGCVHQRPLLAESISIKENLILGNKHVDYERLESLVKEFMPKRKLTDLAKTLTPYERVSLALICVLLKNPKIIIMDEPSALLSAAERSFISYKVREFVSKGNTAIIVSHFVKEALVLCDHVVLLKNGNILLSDACKNVTPAEIGYYLFERHEKADFDVSWPEDLNVEFVHGIIDENNFSRITYEGKKAGLIPADRTFIGSNPNLTILQLLTALKTELPQKEMVEYANKLLKQAQVNIKLDEKASKLSGGMLQRLIVQREIAEKPDVLFLCDPLQGLDINAVEYLFSVLRKLVDDGVRVVVQEAS